MHRFPICIPLIQSNSPNFQSLSYITEQQAFSSFFKILGKNFIANFSNSSF